MQDIAQGTIAHAECQSSKPFLACRFVFVLDGVIEVLVGKGMNTLHADDYAYVPADTPHRYAQWPLLPAVSMSLTEDA